MTDINESLSGCLYFASNKLARSISKMADEEFRITGLSPTYAFLICIVNENTEISQKEISEKLHMTPSTITRFIDKLENKNLVIRRSDGKTTLISLTKKGVELIPYISKAWQNLHERYSSILSEEENQELVIAINKVANKFEGKC